MSRINYLQRVKENSRVYLPWETNPGHPDFVEDESERLWFEHRKMNEDVYQAYADLTSNIRLGSKKNPDERAEMNMKLGSSRMFLLIRLAHDWNATDEAGKTMALTENNLKRMPPEVIRVWVDDIYDKNPILNSDEDEGNTVLTEDGEEVPK
jgi:hypothetical protein